MLPPLPDGAEFKFVGITLVEPQAPCVLDRLAGAGASVGALLNFMESVGFPGLGLFFGGEGLERPLAALIFIINDPGRLFDAL
jgi:hypothetical protein